MQNKLLFHCKICDREKKRTERRAPDGTNINSKEKKRKQKRSENNSDPLINLFINMMNIKLNEN